MEGAVSTKEKRGVDDIFKKEKAIMIKITGFYHKYSSLKQQHFHGFFSMLVAEILLQEDFLNNSRKEAINVKMLDGLSCNYR